LGFESVPFITALLVLRGLLVDLVLLLGVQRSHLGREDAQLFQLFPLPVVLLVSPFLLACYLEVLLSKISVLGANLGDFFSKLDHLCHERLILQGICEFVVFRALDPFKSFQKLRVKLVGTS
jgi:hypothetical protein